MLDINGIIVGFLVGVASSIMASLFMLHYVRKRRIGLKLARPSVWQEDPTTRKPTLFRKAGVYVVNTGFVSLPPMDVWLYFPKDGGEKVWATSPQENRPFHRVLMPTDENPAFSAKKQRGAGLLLCAQVNSEMPLWEGEHRLFCYDFPEGDIKGVQKRLEELSQGCEKPSILITNRTSRDIIKEDKKTGTELLKDFERLISVFWDTAVSDFITHLDEAERKERIDNASLDTATQFVKSATDAPEDSVRRTIASWKALIGR